jgi:hypothetical protein
MNRPNPKMGEDAENEYRGDLSTSLLGTADVFHKCAQEHQAYNRH